MFKRIKLWLTPNKRCHSCCLWCKFFKICYNDFYYKQSPTQKSEDALIALKILRHGEDPCYYCQIQSGKIDGGAFHAACITCGEEHKNFIYDSDHRFG